MIIAVFIVITCLALPMILRRKTRPGPSVLSPKDEAIVARLRHEMVRMCLTGWTPIEAWRYCRQVVTYCSAGTREVSHQLMLIDVAYGRILSD